MLVLSFIAILSENIQCNSEKDSGERLHALDNAVFRYADMN